MCTFIVALQAVDHDPDVWCEGGVDGRIVLYESALIVSVSSKPRISDFTSIICFDTRMIEAEMPNSLEPVQWAGLISFPDSMLIIFAI